MSFRRNLNYFARSLLVLGILATGCNKQQTYEKYPQIKPVSPVAAKKNPDEVKTPLSFGSVGSENIKKLSTERWTVYIKDINGNSRPDSYAVDPQGTYHLMNLDNSRKFGSYTIWRCSDGKTELSIHLETGETKTYGFGRSYVVNGGEESFRFQEGKGYRSISEMLQK
ncbi:MAG: hypothetical protein HY831_00805 [Candidatus Aenigmarchaeota archaeon]|nr:hypothetical protein [Candidatus Aenigmarchaeota archaeon]